MLKRIALLAAVAAVTLGVGCQKSSTASTEAVLHFENSSEPEFMDPNLVNDTVSLHIALNLFEGLVTPHPKTLKPLPGVAERWDVSPDGKTYTFYLRHDAKWSDGKPVVAGDFVYAWKRVLDPKTAARTASNMYPIVNAKLYNEGKLADLSKLGFSAPSDDVFVITLETPLPPFLELLGGPTFSPARKDVIEAKGDRWVRPENIVSNGPFMLTEWIPNKHIILKKSPNYWDAKRVYLDKIVFTPNEDHATNTKLFLSGAIDYMEQVPVSIIDNFRNMPEFMLSRQFAVYYYWINCAHPVLKDVRVRQALSLAIDRKELTNHYLKGLKDPAENFEMPPGIVGYPYKKYLEFNVEKAKKLLAEAGYPDPSKMLPLQIMYNTNEDHRVIAEVVQQMLRNNLGINVTIQNMEWKAYLKQLQNHNFEIGRMGNVGEYVYPIPMLEVFLSGTENNFGQLNSPEFDALWKKAAATANAQERMKIYGQMESILADQMPAIPLYYYKTSTLLQQWVKGLYRNVLLHDMLKWAWVIPHDKVGRSWDTVLEWTRIPWSSNA